MDIILSNCSRSLVLLHKKCDHLFDVDLPLALALRSKVKGSLSEEAVARIGLIERLSTLQSRLDGLAKALA